MSLIEVAKNKDGVARQIYLDVAGSTGGSMRERSLLVKGHGGRLKIARRYHLNCEDLNSLQVRMKTEGFVSPYGTGRVYTYILNSINLLGVNKSHLIIDAYEKFKELGSCPSTKKNGLTLYERFVHKAPQSENTSKDAFSRYVQNIELMQRLSGNHPYGLKLTQIGCCVDLLVDQEKYVYVQLRTGIRYGETVKPVNMTRKRHYRKAVDGLPAGMMIETSDGDTEGWDSDSSDE